MTFHSFLVVYAAWLRRRIAGTRSHTHRDLIEHLFQLVIFKQTPSIICSQPPALSAAKQVVEQQHHSCRFSSSSTAVDSPALRCRQHLPPYHPQTAVIATGLCNQPILINLLSLHARTRWFTCTRRPTSLLVLVSLVAAAGSSSGALDMKRSSWEYEGL